MTVITRSEKGNKLSNAEMDSNLNSLNWRHGGTLSAAATISITDEYNYFNISGSANVSGFSAKHAGYLIRVTFLSGGGTLVHNASTFVLPGNGNISWEVGDTAVFVNTSSNAWKCIDYTKQSLSPADYFTTSAVDGDLLPDTTNTRDLGSTTKQWRSLYIDGVGYIDSLSLSDGTTVQEFSTDTTLSGNSDSVVPTEAAVKGYVGTVGAHAYGAINENSGSPIFNTGASYGVNTSITDNGPGDYTVTLSTACSSVNFTVVACASGSAARMCTGSTVSDNQIRIRIWDSGGTPTDTNCKFVVFDNDQGL